MSHTATATAIYGVLIGGGVSVATGLLTGLGVTRYGDRRSKRVRHEQRRVDAYLQVLTTIELLGPAVQRRGYQPLPDADLAAVAAIVFAFASSDVRAAYAEWRRPLDWYRREQHEATSNENGSKRGLAAGTIVDEIRPRERLTRHALQSVITRELGYREPDPLPELKPLRNLDIPIGQKDAAT